MDDRSHITITIDHTDSVQYEYFSLWSTTQNKVIFLYIKYDSLSHTLTLFLQVGGESEEKGYNIDSMQSLHEHLCTICPEVSYTLNILHNQYKYHHAHLHDGYILRFDSQHPDTMLFEHTAHTYYDIYPEYYTIPAPLPATHRIPSHVPWAAIVPPTDRIITQHYVWAHTPNIYSHPHCITHIQHIQGSVNLHIKVSICKEGAEYTIHMHESNVALHSVFHRITDTHPIQNHGILTPEQVESITTSFPQYIQEIRRHDPSIPPWSQHTIIHTCGLLSTVLSNPDTHAYILSMAETAQSLFTAHYRYYPGPKGKNTAITQAAYALATPPICLHTPEYPHQYLPPDHPTA